MRHKLTFRLTHAAQGPCSLAAACIRSHLTGLSLARLAGTLPIIAFFPILNSIPYHNRIIPVCQGLAILVPFCFWTDGLQLRQFHQALM